MTMEKEEQASTGSIENGAVKDETQIQNSDDLKRFLRSVIDKMSDDQAPPIYGAAAINHLLTRPDIYDLLDNENKELARDVWLRLKSAGFQLRNPPILFGSESK